MIRYWKGRLWLKQGFCPYCYSSPPREECPVCQGDYKYFGKNVDAEKRALWRERYEQFWKVFKA